MGELTTFRCNACGYVSAAIRWGVSVQDPRRRFLPAHCGKCCSYVEIDLTGADLLVDDFFCPECGTQVFFLQEAATYSCPSCGSKEMHLIQGPSYW